MGHIWAAQWVLTTEKNVENMVRPSAGGVPGQGFCSRVQASFVQRGVGKRRFLVVISKKWKTHWVFTPRKHLQYTQETHGPDEEGKESEMRIYFGERKGDMYSRACLKCIRPMVAPR